MVQTAAIGQRSYSIGACVTNREKRRSTSNRREEWSVAEAGSNNSVTDVITEMGAGSLDFVRAGDADARTAERFRRDVRLWLRRSFALSEDRIADIVLAVYEALANAAEFAYLAAPGDGTMRLAAHHDASTASGLRREFRRWGDKGTRRAVQFGPSL